MVVYYDYPFIISCTKENESERELKFFLVGLTASENGSICRGGDGSGASATRSVAGAMKLKPELTGCVGCWPGAGDVKVPPRTPLNADCCGGSEALSSRKKAKADPDVGATAFVAADSIRGSKEGGSAAPGGSGPGLFRKSRGSWRGAICCKRDLRFP